MHYTQRNLTIICMYMEYIVHMYLHVYRVLSQSYPICPVLCIMLDADQNVRVR